MENATHMRSAVRFVFELVSAKCLGRSRRAKFIVLLLTAAEAAAAAAAVLCAALKTGPFAHRRSRRTTLLFELPLM